jgi:formamidopyrimidine-DNA glycosylase
VPEILEVEQARTLLDIAALDRVVVAVHAPDAWFLKRGLTPHGVELALLGRRFTTARRRGKLLLLDTDGAGPVLGLHLGMSGRVLVDGAAAGDPLVYASNRDVVAWRRFGVDFAGGGSLHLRDPRRLGSVELDPDEDRLGIDAFELSARQLDGIVSTSRAPVKAVLLNQRRIAGLGNLLADEALWRGGVDPARCAQSLSADARRALHRAIRTTLRVLGRRGGSHTGSLMPERRPGGVCPRDGARLLRRTVGGRTTYSCPVHQR